MDVRPGGASFSIMRGTGDIEMPNPGIYQLATLAMSL